MDSVLRCLRDSAGRYELTGNDEEFALMLLEKNGIIGKTMVYQEGDRIRKQTAKPPVFKKTGRQGGQSRQKPKVDKHDSGAWHQWLFCCGR